MANTLTSYLMAIVMFALSLTVQKIFVNQEFPYFDLENEGQGHGVEKQDLHQSTRNIRVHIADFFSEL